MSRLTFGPWQIEKYPLFEKHLGWVTSYDNPQQLVIDLEHWMTENLIASREAAASDALSR